MSADHKPPALPDQDAHCLNCGALLVGEYCARCGQHVKHHVHSTWETVKEFFEDLFHTDQRLWRTLVPLTFRPGLLTLEYLRGRRVSFTPPFRLYIVLSLIFFVFFSIDNPYEENNVVIAPVVTGEKSKERLADPAADPEVRAMIERLVASTPEKDKKKARDGLVAALKELPAGSVRAAARNEDMCTPATLSWLPANLGANERLLTACRKMTTNGSGFGEAIGHNLPKMMFVFLPLIALTGKLLYFRPRHYYAEHLLFFVHYHSFFFFASTLSMVVALLFGWLQAIGAGPWMTASYVLTATVTIYVPVYLLLAMRRVYAQGWWLTSAKFLLLTIAYLTCLLLTFVGLITFTALTL